MLGHTNTQSAPPPGSLGDPVHQSWPLESSQVHHTPLAMCSAHGYSDGLEKRRSYSLHTVHLVLKTCAPRSCPCPLPVTESKCAQDITSFPPALTASHEARTRRCWGRRAWEPSPSLKGAQPKQGCVGRANSQMDKVRRAHEEIHRKIVKNYFPKPYHNQAETTD